MESRDVNTGLVTSRLTIVESITRTVEKPRGFKPYSEGAVDSYWNSYLVQNSNLIRVQQLRLASSFSRGNHSIMLGDADLLSTIKAPVDRRECFDSRLFVLV